MRMNSRAPSYPTGNTVTLGGLGMTGSYTFEESDGTTYVVMVDNTVYRLNDETGVLTLDSNMTATLRQIDAASPGIVQQQASSSWDMNSLLSNLSSVVTTVVTAYAQNQLLQTNIDRAKAGLPPLNAQAYMPGVNVGVTSDTKNMVYIVVAGIGAAILLASSTKSRRG